MVGLTVTELDLIDQDPNRAAPSTVPVLSQMILAAHCFSTCWGEAKPTKSTVKTIITIADLELRPKSQKRAVETKALVKTSGRSQPGGTERATLRLHRCRVADDPNYALRRPAAV